MKCFRCDVEMISGIAIDPKREERALYIASPPNLNKDTLELIEVFKCPKCGHSEYINSSYK